MMAGALKVIIVDDEPTILMSLSHYLQAKGAQVSTCREWGAARDALRGGGFDLAIIDLCLSGGGRLDGLGLVPIAKRANPDMLVIVITAFGTDDLRRQALEYGAAAYFTKPVNLDQLLHAVHGVRPATPAA